MQRSLLKITNPLCLVEEGRLRLNISLANTSNEERMAKIIVIILKGEDEEVPHIDLHDTALGCLKRYANLLLVCWGKLRRQEKPEQSLHFGDH